jgi:hypothetical protein
MMIVSSGTSTTQVMTPSTARYAAVEAMTASLMKP